MTDTRRTTAETRPSASRLQRRRPASLQINPPSTHWNIAIPLLSPLDSSPTAVEIKSRSNPPPQSQRSVAEVGEKPVVFKKWQHPAAPFYCESTQRAPSFLVL